MVAAFGASFLLTSASSDPHIPSPDLASAPASTIATSLSALSCRSDSTMFHSIQSGFLFLPRIQFVVSAVFHSCFESTSFPPVVFCSRSTSPSVLFYLLEFNLLVYATLLQAFHPVRHFCLTYGLNNPVHCLPQIVSYLLSFDLLPNLPFIPMPRKSNGYVHRPVISRNTYLIHSRTTTPRSRNKPAVPPRDETPPTPTV